MVLKFIRLEINGYKFVFYYYKIKKGFKLFKEKKSVTIYLTDAIIALFVGFIVYNSSQDIIASIVVGVLFALPVGIIRHRKKK